MAHETVPADIEAAIKAYADAVAHGSYGSSPERGIIGTLEIRETRAALISAILAHLRGCAEMKAALERIEQGV
jgi:hypothetical protein